ncbi:hypothetical protein N7448_000107 [Penicillium atrosanguineum]|uniref:Methyltransferase domain-containing protein n=1 Tax=Penicillium atrosanguineum TaxID=1132637 RepID=A0A9W9Q2F9_9EURO|nr:RNA-directed RNA polymerase [Penicillium atrosanguineum]KAJ5134870.1 hypothetical protein N7526_006235 [Penicillium atrosanguineum]KAJ5148529.1 hypothetical protein N7448_000107 [Penicillium atrosanguineum]KAJ5303848.1 RNA-directed RNA polymerase [Penicillium atrosanguineum]KAJ5323323.1 hypothetical protein N7476_001923 [Penicillium atrosanguineum]
MGEFSTEERDIYSSKYLVDYYDIVAPSSKSVDDESFYWGCYQELMTLRPPTSEDPFVVLDLGTGTGRVLHGLAASAKVVGVDFTDTVLTGVDTAKDMLRKAEEVTKEPLKGHVTWVHGSALDLESIMREQENHKVDLLIFSIGSISHLSEDDQPQVFLNQISKVLRRDTGRAYISIYDGSVIQKRGSITFHQPEGVTEVPSMVYPGIIYREYNHRGELRDKIKYIKFDLDVVERTDGEDREVEKNRISMKMRQWDEDEIVSISNGSGVKFSGSSRGKHETFYAFQVAA